MIIGDSTVNCLWENVYLIGCLQKLYHGLELA